MFVKPSTVENYGLGVLAVRTFGTGETFGCYCGALVYIFCQEEINKEYLRGLIHGLHRHLILEVVYVSVIDSTDRDVKDHSICIHCSSTILCEILFLNDEMYFPGETDPLVSGIRLNKFVASPLDKTIYMSFNTSHEFLTMMSTKKIDFGD